MTWMAIAACTYVIVILSAPHVPRWRTGLKQTAFVLGLVLAAHRALGLAPDFQRLRASGLLVGVAFASLSAAVSFALAEYPRNPTSAVQAGMRRLAGFPSRLLHHEAPPVLARLTLLAAHEELIWRGAVEPVIGTVLSAVAFSLAHIPMSRKVRAIRHGDLFVLALLCSASLKITGSLVSAIIVHSLRNWACCSVPTERESSERTGRPVKLDEAPSDR